MQAYAFTFLAALCITYLATPFIIKLALRFGVVDIPDPRKIHSANIPRWGGLALVPGIFSALVFAYFVSSSFRQSLNSEHRWELWGIAGACLLMLMVGMMDDRHPIRAKTKLFWQVVAAAWLIIFGVRISFITLPLSKHLDFLPRYLGIGISLVWIVGITNALNLLDGLDGLLAGISTLSSLALFGIAVQKGYVFPAFILLAMCGSTLAFLRYNFNPATIFLGDAGSLLLGTLWASISISGALKTTTIALFIPILILGLPIADTFFAIARRFGKGQPIFAPDKEHLHHRLLKLGMSQRKAVLTLYLVGGILGLLAFFLNYWL